MGMLEFTYDDSKTVNNLKGNSFRNPFSYNNNIISHSQKAKFWEIYMIIITLNSLLFYIKFILPLLLLVKTIESKYVLYY